MKEEHREMELYRETFSEVHAPDALKGKVKDMANLSLAIKRETDGIIDSTINQKGNKNKYMTNMNELIGYLIRHFGEYMDADTLTQKFDIIRSIFDFAISHRAQDKKGSGVSSPRTVPRKVKHHYNNKTTHKHLL